MLYLQETYPGQLVTAGVPDQLAEVVEVLDPEQDAAPTHKWCRLFGAPTGLFASLELRPALIPRGMEFIAKNGAIAPRAVVLRHNSSDKDPIEVSIGQHPPQRFLRREFLKGWRALWLTGEAHD